MILEKKDPAQMFKDLQLIVKTLRDENTELKTKLAANENQKKEIKDHFNKQIYGNFQAFVKEAEGSNVDEFVIIPLKKFMELSELHFKKITGDFSLLPSGKTEK